MLDEQEFRRRAETAIDDLKRRLIAAETSADLEVEEQNGVLHVGFEDPPAKFVITPNAPARQIWISALATSFKLDWSAEAETFVLTKSAETLTQLVSRLINQQLGENAVTLS